MAVRQRPNKHYTLLGKPIDMAAIAAKHSQTVALGNAGVNARGDIVDKKGTILKTQEQIEEEWRRAKELRNSSVGISSDIKTPLPGVVPTKNISTDDQAFDPNTAAVDATNKQTQTAQQRRRKIVDAD